MTTPRRADLAGLFTSPPGETSSFRQGVIESFDPATGANQVRIGGAVLENLPILISGDTVNYAEDDVVMLLRYQTSWAILGRIVTPGNEALTATAVDFDARGDQESNFAITNTFAEHGRVEMDVPAWANSALVFATSMIVATNTSGASDSVRMQTRINGAAGAEAIEQVPDGNFETVSVPNAAELTVAGGSVITAECFVRCNGATPWPGGGVQSTVNAIAVFRRA